MFLLVPALLLTGIGRGGSGSRKDIRSSAREKHFERGDRKGIMARVSTKAIEAACLAPLLRQFQHTNEKKRQGGCSAEGSLSSPAPSLPCLLSGMLLSH